MRRRLGYLFAEVTPGWSGVEDSFVGPSKEAKNQAREAEQRASAKLFGLPDDHLFILHMPEDAQGDLVNDEPTKARLFAFLDQVAPDLVLLPWEEDTNPDPSAELRILRGMGGAG